MSKEEGKEEKKVNEKQVEEIRARVDTCAKEVSESLQKHECRIAVSMVITEAGNLPQVQVVPLENK